MMRRTLRLSVLLLVAYAAALAIAPEMEQRAIVDRLPAAKAWRGE